MRRILIILTIIALFPGAGVSSQSLLFFKIPLKSGTISLERGKFDLTEKYVIVQFVRTLKRKEIVELRESGIILLSFLYEKAWICAMEPSSLTEEVIEKYTIAAVTPWKPEYKISPELIDGEFEEWAVAENGFIKLLVTFYDDVDPKNMESLLRLYSPTYEIYYGPTIWAIQVAPGKIDGLINETIIQYIEEGPPPLEPLNNLSRSIINVAPVQNVDLTVTPPYYNGLSGQGVNIAVSESVHTNHPDFWDHDVFGNPTFSRFLNPRTGGGAHGTHVAGIIGGNGWNSDKISNTGTRYQWRGMAPEARLIDGHGYGLYRVDASNHSYVMNYGDYGGRASSVDKDIRGGRGLTYQKTHIWAVANQGMDAEYGNICLRRDSNGKCIEHDGTGEEGYYSIYAPGKNIIGVGAVNSNDASLAVFSSLGPTFDGRIKPDVMAAGSCDPIPESFDSPGEAVREDIDYIRVIDASNNVVRSWEFETPGELEGWSDYVAGRTEMNVTVADGYLTVRHPLNRGVSYLGYGQVDLFAEPGHIVEIRYRIENRGAPPFTLQTLLNWDGESGGADYDGRILYDTIIDGQFHTVKLPVGASGRKMIDHWYDAGTGGWGGKVDKFWFIFAQSQNIVSTSHIDGGYYWGNRGTSMAAPAVTGTVALMLQQFVETHNVNLNYENNQTGNPPPIPSTIKAILIQTATDLIHETPCPKDGDNPDTGSPVLYHEGPDFATGYGLLNADSATHFISDAATDSLLYESELDSDQRDIYKINVPFSLPELKLTLVWDDIETSASLGDARLARLVNDLDLVLIDPEGNRHYPWRLDPLPFADCGGAPPGCGALDPIRSSDVRPAYKGPDARNNVEQIKIDNPSMGEWKVVVEGFGIQDVSDGPQSYSLVSSQSLSKITEFSYILSPNSIHSLDMRVNKMDGTFSIPFSVGDDLGVNYAESAIADFDGDGNLDYIVSTNENPARFYHYTMGCCGTFLGYLDDDPKAAYYLSRDRPLLAPDYGLGLIAADLDNDGDMDFLENINYDFGGGKLWIAKGNAHLNDGSGNFTKVSDAFDFHMISTGWTLGMSSTIVDINGDGYPDMLASEQSRGVAVSSKVYLLKGLGNGKFELVDANEDGVFDKTDDYVFQTDHHPATHITLGDFNNDGKVDALVGQDDDGDPGAAFLFLGHGDGTFDQTGIEAFDVCKDIESGTDQPCAGKFQAYDADSDGILDILSAYKLKEIYDPDENSRFVFLKGKGDGTFDDDNPLPVRLAGCDSSIGEPCIIHMTGFQVPVTFPVHLKIHGDFTGDRCIDRDDLEMILNHIRRVRHPLLRDANFDLNDDGDVNIADVRYLVTRFTNYRGAPCP